MFACRGCDVEFRVLVAVGNGFESYVSCVRFIFKLWGVVSVEVSDVGGYRVGVCEWGFRRFLVE